MSDAEAATNPPAPASPKKATKAKGGASAKKPRAKPSHPKTSDMVNAAIKDLKERGGSSLQAIKKYISSNYKVDAEKMAPFIRKYLKSAVTSGSLVQTKGKGAMGSFKLSGSVPAEKSAAKVSKPKTAKPKSSPKPKKAKPGTASAAAAAKKPASAKKAATKKPSSPKKAESKTKAKSKPKPTSPKTKAVAKSPTKKPKAPKPKKTTAAKTKSPKKAAPKKK